MPGINNCRFPTKCPKRKVTRNRPETAESTFLKIVDVKYVFIKIYT
jgi:hypothetical protein